MSIQKKALTLQKIKISKIADMNNSNSSGLFSRAVEEFSQLPGVGHKSAVRLVLHMLRQEPDAVDRFTEAVKSLRHEVKYCKVCHNISDDEVCDICRHPERDRSMICVVENIQDVMAIEATTQYKGLYHVLGGVISPMDGIGPSDLHIDSLIDRVEGHEVKEIILALSSTMEGDTTNYYISRKMVKYPDVKITILARGISVNDELQYTDEITLGRSIINRVEYS